MRARGHTLISVRGMVQTAVQRSYATTNAGADILCYCSAEATIGILLVHSSLDNSSDHVCTPARVPPGSTPCIAE
ncbi:hypothetical protein SETIT_8G116400v2 [Setaria italica]|uniref:Uncharacterized protein n=2 Tax=Setaria TaxID=4554 RepID=A0A368S6Q9_SETIT|nr:hypothetical protein SETIT_8G116400v2 [Setaria italica]TKW00615.1 hypothetical protein SEVIR_8G122500v2 [Setaria viridis]